MPIAAANMGRLGIVAGGGGLPLAIMEAERRRGALPYLMGIREALDARVAPYVEQTVSVGELDLCATRLIEAGCTHVCLVGYVQRPNLSEVRIDRGGEAILPAFLAALPKGDDAILRVLLDYFEKRGLVIVSASELTDQMTASAGALTSQKPNAEEFADIERAEQFLRAISPFDVGQSVVICHGLFLAIEAQEGTDAMLERVAKLPAPLRGTPQERKGLLVKQSKRGQSLKVDLPTLGPATLDRVKEAGLAGIAFEAERTLIIDRAACIAKAETMGIFLWAAAVQDG